MTFDPKLFRVCSCPCHTGEKRVFCSCFGPCCPENHAVPSTVAMCLTCRKWVKLTEIPEHKGCRAPEPLKGFTEIRLPSLKQVVSSPLAAEIAAVQPMSGPVGAGLHLQGDAAPARIPAALSQEAQESPEVAEAARVYAEEPFADGGLLGAERIVTPKPPEGGEKR